MIESDESPVGELYQSCNLSPTTIVPTRAPFVSVVCIYISLSVIRGISPWLKYNIAYKCSQVPFSQVANTCETRYDVIIGTESKSHKEGSRIPEQVELGNRIHEHKTSENKQKEKKEETAPAQNYKYIRDFYSVLQQTPMVSLWCTYGELGAYRPLLPYALWWSSHSASAHCSHSL